MKRLFTKLFLGAGTIILLSMVITVALAVFSSSGPVKMHRQHIHEREKLLVYDILGLYSLEAADTLSTDGIRGLDAYEKKLGTLTHSSLFLFTDEYVPISPQKIPEPITGLVKRLSPSSPAGIARDKNTLIAARIFSDKNNRRYVAAISLSLPSNDPFDRRFPLPKDFWLRILVSFLLCGTICYALARHLTIPLDNLRIAARKLGEGDLSSRVSPVMGKRSDEIGDLGQDFDRMAEKIECLVESQKQLIRDISHELRSPLARLTVALELARQRGSEDVFPQLDRIGMETERLNIMIGQILTLARLESGAHRDPESMDVSLIIREIADDARFEAQARHIEITVDVPETLPYSGYPEMLHRAIENIVRNALRYSSEGMGVTITATRAGIELSWICITVKDQGPGVPDSALPHLFKPFYRIEDSRDRSKGGTGLGLSIAKRAVSLHHGDLTVENSENGGLVVHILLPLDME